MDPRISCDCNKENVPPSSKYALGPSLPHPHCNEMVERRTPLEDVTHLFVPHLQLDAAGSSVAYSIDQEDVLLPSFRHGGGASSGTSLAKTKATVTQRTCRPCLRKSFR